MKGRKTKTKNKQKIKNKKQKRKGKEWFCFFLGKADFVRGDLVMVKHDFWVTSKKKKN